MVLPSIALEEQFISSNAHAKVPPELKDRFSTFSHPWYEKLIDLAPNGPRIQAMDAGEVSVSVLSNVPGISSFAPEDVAQGNDELFAAAQKQPRYKCFASLPMASPTAAEQELERCVCNLNFVGALIDSHLSDGSYYDDNRFWPVFAKAEELDVPIYIHPMFPTDVVHKHLFAGSYSSQASMILGIAAWGWHADAALSVLRMYCSGVFQKYPNLKIVIGHMGEMMPYMLTRIDEKLSIHWARGEVSSFREVWGKNIWVTTSGMFDLGPMECLLKTTNIQHILYSVDYPWSNMEQGKDFLLRLKESGLVSEEELELIAFRNSEKLLKFTVPCSDS